MDQLRDEIRFEPHFTIEGTMIDSANRINRIADCSNNRGDLVKELRICARKVQAGSLQLSSIIRESGGERAGRMEEIERENYSLKKCIEELTEEIQVMRQIYTKDDFEDRKKMEKMEKEIKELKEEKEKMRREVDELRNGKERRDQTTKTDQNKERGKMNKAAENKEEKMR